jgi:hypothetical protein
MMDFHYGIVASELQTLWYHLQTKIQNNFNKNSLRNNKIN